MRRGHESTPIRTCVGCQARDAQPAMLRLRLASGGTISVAARGRGRSAYVHERPGCVAALVRSKGLGKSLRAAIATEARRELVGMLEQRLQQGTPA